MNAAHNDDNDDDNDDNDDDNDDDHNDDDHNDDDNDHDDDDHDDDDSGNVDNKVVLLVGDLRWKKTTAIYEVHRYLLFIQVLSTSQLG